MPILIAKAHSDILNWLVLSDQSKIQNYLANCHARQRTAVNLHVEAASVNELNNKQRAEVRDNPKRNPSAPIN